MKIAIIGCGVMGSEMVKQLIQKKILIPKDITITRRNKPKLVKFAVRMKVNFTTNNIEAIKNANVIILAVRPQEMFSVLNEISIFITPNQMIIPIAVGLTIDFYEHFLTKNPIIRIMPNPFISSSLGIIAFSRNKHTASNDIKKMRLIFSQLCTKLIEIKDKQMYLFTTLTSSSSAIYYYIINAMIEKGVESGLTEKIAKEISFVSAKAAIMHAQNSKTKLATLIDEACTPNGMTISGIKYLKEKKVHEHIKKALQKIIRRSIKINSELRRHQK